MSVCLSKHVRGCFGVWLSVSERASVNVVFFYILFYLFLRIFSFLSPVRSIPICARVQLSVDAIEEEKSMEECPSLCEHLEDIWCWMSHCFHSVKKCTMETGNTWERPVCKSEELTRDVSGCHGYAPGCAVKTFSQSLIWDFIRLCFHDKAILSAEVKLQNRIRILRSKGCRWIHVMHERLWIVHFSIFMFY